MKLGKKRITIINNLISGIGIIALGVIVTIGSINLYTALVNLLVYAFIIFGLSNLINFLLNRKIVRNAETLILIFSNIVLGIVMLVFPKFQLSLIPIIFSIYLLLNSVVKFINYMILKEVKLKSRFKELFISLFFVILSFTFLFYPLDNLNLFIMFIGIYCIILGLSKINEFLTDTLSKKAKSEIKKRAKMTLPAFFEAFFPQRSLKKINKYIDYLMNEEKNIDIDTDLKIFIHLSTYGLNQFGHIDIMIDNVMYSYGNYDRSSRKFFDAFGDGVLFSTNQKEKYINFCLDNNRETIVEYGIETTNNQKEKIKERLYSILSDAYEWKSPVRVEKNIKKLYYSDKLYKATGCKFYKFKNSEFKTFFIAGINCTYFINVLLKSKVFQSLKLAGILSPGTYYEYLEENYKKKNSSVVYRKIYNKDSIGDLDVKNKK